MWCTYSNSLKQNSASSHVLIFQQLFSLFRLFHWALQEKTGEFWQGNIIPVKIHPLEKSKKYCIYSADMIKIFKKKKIMEKYKYLSFQINVNMIWIIT